MKDFWKVSLIGITVLLIGACATTTRTTPEEHWEYAVTEQRRLGSPAIENGVVRYRGNVVPTYFSEFVVGNRRFEYIFRSDEQTFRGYRLDDEWEERAEVNESLDDLGRSQRNRGWYLGDFNELKPGTPDDWIWVRRESLSAWVAPRRIESLAETHELARMVRTAEARQPTGQVRIQIGVRQTFTGRR